MNIISNAFSINMLTLAAKVRFMPLSVNETKGILLNVEYKSAIGHKETAAIVSNILGMPIECNRMTVKFPVEWFESHRLIVAQYSGLRLMEGTTSLPIGSTLEFWYCHIDKAI